MKPSKSADTSRVSADHIAFSLIRAIVEQRLAPGARLGEEELGAVFQVSRTVVRQALTQLASQGIVGVKPRKGWFVVEPSEKEVRDVFAARRLIEGPVIEEFTRTASRAQVKALKKHVHDQHGAIASNDAALRTNLLADFHVQIAEMMGNPLVTRIVHDLTMRSNLISMLYQTNQEASHSADEHEQILQAIEERNAAEATRLMVEHINNVEAGLQNRKNRDPIQLLQETLSWNVSRDAKPAAVKARGKRNPVTGDA